LAGFCAAPLAAFTGLAALALPAGASTALATFLPPVLLLDLLPALLATAIIDSSRIFKDINNINDFYQ
jgi:hypothetical protein